MWFLRLYPRNQAEPRKEGGNMVSIGIAPVMVEGKRKWIVSKTTDGKEFKTEILEKTIEEILEELGTIEDEIVIGFDHWGSTTLIETIANFISERSNMKISLEKLTGEYKARLSAEQLAVNVLNRFR